MWENQAHDQVGIQRFEEWHWADVDRDGLLDLFGYVPAGTAQPQLFSFRNLGNVGHVPRWRVALPDGTCYWTVQAVAHAWRGQPWLTEKSFTITAPLPRRISDFQWIDFTQVRLAFNGQPGRQVALQTSSDLTRWIDRTTFTIGLSGRLEATVSVTGNSNFFRFVLR